MLVVARRVFTFTPFEVWHEPTSLWQDTMLHAGEGLNTVWDSDQLNLSGEEMPDEFVSRDAALNARNMVDQGFHL
jgi:hypothetical protein